MKISKEQRERSDLTRLLVGRLLDVFTGGNETRLCDNKPSQVLFIGTLLPKRDPSLARGRAYPSEMGLEVLIAKKNADQALLNIDFQGAFYYRVFPTLNEQTQPFTMSAFLSEEESLMSESERVTPIPIGQKLRLVFQKIGPILVSAQVKLGELLQYELGKELEIKEAKKLAQIALKFFDDDPNRYRSGRHSGRTLAKREEEMKIPVEVLENEKAFKEHIAENWTGREPRPRWDSAGTIKVEDYDPDSWKVTVTLCNNLREDKERDDIENAIFETKIALRLENATFQPFVLEYLRDDYRFDGNINACGINCTIRKVNDTWFETEHAPIYQQMRYRPKRFEGGDLTELAKEPLPILRGLENEMKSMLYELEAEFEREAPMHSRIWRHRFREDIDSFKREIARFSEGLHVLEKVPQALEAFKLMNAAFMSSSKSFTHWYRFQIVFIVMLIPDMVATFVPSIVHHRDKVDLIYFPTGGGKTEAYLGVVVFQMFLDRLMGKRSGVSAITRFPLRLLSLQQIQRITDIFAAAEKIRRSHPVIGGKGFDSFSTGYFVGERNTPNKLIRAGYEGESGVDNLTPIKEGGKEKEMFKIVPICPFCGEGKVELEADFSRIRILHKCTKCGEIIPVYISDDEIYRYLPTLIVGTLDKSASAAWRYHFRHIFGIVTSRCPDHGYVSGGECMYHQAGYGLCKHTSYEPVSLLDPTPSLLIQDEMHLVRESLGSYDSHYETFFDQLQLGITEGKKHFKIIAASATISRYEQQLRHLYVREGWSFPSHGQRAKDSFYAREEPEIARFIIGIMPHRITPIHAVLHVLRAYTELLHSLHTNPTKLIPDVVGSVKDAEFYFSDLRLKLSYNLKKMEGDAVHHSVRTMVNPALRRKNIPEIIASSLTGDVGFGDVRQLLEQIEDLQAVEKPDLIVATSAISHGVDLDFLNFIVFHGMPTSTAEYLQAYSRVGRKYPGIVIVVFNHIKERDVSHYKYFLKYHEVLELLIEPVPINRWAKFSVYRTLPGIFCAAILNYFEPIKQKMGVRRLYMSKDMGEALSRGQITEEEILEFILKSYKVEQAPEGRHFATIIKERLHIYVDEILQSLQSSKNQHLPMAISDTPMTNLRDTDIPVEISATSESYAAMRAINPMIIRGDD